MNTTAVRYYACVLTMAEAGGDSQLRAKALARLTEALGTGAPRPGQCVYIHDGARIVHATADVRALLGADLVGRPSLSVVHESRRRLIARRVAITLGGQQAPVWQGPLVRLDGRPLIASVVTRPITWEGRPASQVSVVDLDGYARLV